MYYNSRLSSSLPAERFIKKPQLLRVQAEDFFFDTGSRLLGAPTVEP
jgi:hypothetical protein